MTLNYQGRELTVQATDDAAAPFILVGKRGGTLALVRTSARNSRLFWVKRANGRLDAGMVAQLADGELLWLPTSGPLAATNDRIWRARRAA